MTVAELAEACGLDPATVSRLERGQQWPSRKKYLALRRVFPHLTLEELAFPCAGVEGRDSA